MLRTANHVTIHTGNVLSLMDIKMKAGNVVEELSESLEVTIADWASRNETIVNGTENSTVVEQNGPVNEKLYITRLNDDVGNKMGKEARKDLKIGVKIFINEPIKDYLTECLESVFTALQTETIENVILAYNPPNLPEITDADNVEMDMEADNEADSPKCEALLPGLKILWQVLEDYVKQGRINELGVADADLSCVRRLRGWARVQPTIVHISLRACCVVPPRLHAFCLQHKVQLLTHADPSDLLSEAAQKGLRGLGAENHTLTWCARYQVHIKCRGVLALKGYVCRASQSAKRDKA